LVYGTALGEKDPTLTLPEDGERRGEAAEFFSLRIFVS
jgi:hypothetical protein